MIRLRVREVAEAQGVNKLQLARRAAIGRNTVYAVWDGDRNAKILTLEKIARVLRVPVSALFEEVEGDLDGEHNKAPGNAG